MQHLGLGPILSVGTAIDTAAIALFVGAWLSLTKPFVDAFSLKLFKSPSGTPLQAATVRLWGLASSVAAVFFVIYAPASAIAGFYAVVAVLSSLGLYHIATSDKVKPADVESIVKKVLDQQKTS